MARVYVFEAMEKQADLFGAKTNLPTGFRYQPDILDDRDERRLVQHIAEQDLAPFEFHGFLGKRRIVSYGWKYDYGAKYLRPVGDIPDFLLPAREAA